MFRQRVLPLILILSLPLVLLAACGEDSALVDDPVISVTPSSIDFPIVLVGTFDSALVTIQNTGNGTLVIDELSLDVNTADIGFGVEYPDMMEIASGEERIIEVLYTPTEALQAQGDLVIVSNDRESPQIRVPINTPAPQPSLRVESPNLNCDAENATSCIVDFGLVSENSETAVELTVLNAGTAPAVITDMFLVGSMDFSAPDVADFTLPITLGVIDPNDATTRDAASITFEAIYNPPTPGPDEGAIRVEYNSSTGEAFDVELSGAAGLPGLTVTPNPIDFGFSPIGLTSSETVTLTNTGDLPIYIWEISLSPDSSNNFNLSSLNPALTVPENSIQLPANGTLPFIAEFTPPDENAYGGQVIIVHSNDEAGEDQQLTQVILSGVGVDNRCPVAVARGFIRDDPQQRRSQQIDWATPTDILVLDGSGSFDPDGDVELWEWEMTRSPEGTTTGLRPLDGFPEDTSRRQFFVPLSGRYEFTLRVWDDVGFQDCEDPAVVTVLSIPDERIHIELGWHNPLDPTENDDVGSDVDLHFTKVGWNWFDGRFDTYYANDAPDWAPELPSLDIDDTDGAGPENVQMDNPLDCQWYAIGVHYFEKQFGTAYATIRVYIDSEQIVELVNRPLESTDDFWDVGRLHWPTGEFFVIDEIYENFDSSSATPPSITPEMAAAVEGGSCSN